MRLLSILIFAFASLFLTTSHVPAQTLTPTPSPSSHATPPPKAIYFPQPEYPFEARRHGLQGHGTFLLTVEANGRVSHVDTSDGVGASLLDRAGVDAFMRWRFPPAHHSWKVHVPLSFHLDANPESTPEPFASPNSLASLDSLASTKPSSTPEASPKPKTLRRDYLWACLIGTGKFLAAPLPVLLLLLATGILQWKRPQPLPLVMLIIVTIWFLDAIAAAIVTSPFFPFYAAVKNLNVLRLDKASPEELSTMALVVAPVVLGWIFFVTFALLLALYFSKLKTATVSSTSSEVTASKT